MSNVYATAGAFDVIQPVLNTNRNVKHSNTKPTVIKSFSSHCHQVSHEDEPLSEEIAIIYLH